jgi:hypothetical protein
MIRHRRPNDCGNSVRVQFEIRVLNDTSETRNSPEGAGLLGGISFVGGWFSLARVYRTQVAFDGAKWRMRSGRMRWLANYNNLLTLGASQQGLYLASMFLFRFMHPPLLVPWSEIKVRRSKGWVFEYVILRHGT